MLSYKLSLRQVFEALERNNAIAGGGYIEHQREQLLIRGEALATQVADLARIVVAHGPGGVPIYISDLAEVKEASALRIGAATAMGEERNRHRNGPDVGEARTRNRLLNVSKPE